MRDYLIADLTAIQRNHGYIPLESLQELSRQRKVPLYRYHEVASFYPHFRLKPPPASEVLVCDDLSCHLQGAPRLLTALRQRLSDDAVRDVHVSEISCLGQCDRAPAASVNGRILAGVTSDLLSRALGDPTAADQHSAASTAPGTLRIDPYGGDRPYRVYRDLARHGDVDSVLTALKASGLRGMGGAGFPTAWMWVIVRAAAGDEKYVICNADESEPGTTKDRFILDVAPHLVVEGLLIAGLVVGAGEGIIYIRHEYEHQRAALERELERCRAERLIGDDVLRSGRRFGLSIFTSPGGYICGEESALLEALEDKRAEPRNKPPFPGTHGLYGKPTAINNVETFALVPGILVNGPEAFAAQGRDGAPGLKFVAVSGHVAHPGVYEVPLGTSVRHVIYDLAGGVPNGRALKAFAPSGASSGFLPATMVDVGLDFEPLRQAGSMLGSGALVVCDDTTCMLDVALNAVRFFKTESCGKCVPCRIGSAKMLDLLVRIRDGMGTQADLDAIPGLADTLVSASICGLGQVVPSPVTSVQKHFPGEIEAHVTYRRCPAGACSPMAPAPSLPG